MLQLEGMSKEKLEYELYRYRAYVENLYIRDNWHLRNKDAARDREFMLSEIKRLETELAKFN